MFGCLIVFISPISYSHTEQAECDNINLYLIHQLLQSENRREIFCLEISDNFCLEVMGRMHRSNFDRTLLKVELYNVIY